MTEPVAPAKPSLLGRLVRGTLTLLALGALGVVAALAAVLGPPIRDDVLLDRIVRAVALDWRDFGLPRAQERLAYELDAQRIGAQVGDESCMFTEHPDGARVVRCDWVSYLLVPGRPEPIALSFASEARVEPNGDLR